MKCKLCLEEKPLLKKSHIVSDFLFEDVFDEKNRMAVFRLQNKSMTNNHIVQSSYWESDLLCYDCDNVKLGKIEGYAKSKLFIPVIEYSKNLPPPKQNLSEVFTVDYQRIKLFFLSLLWRMSISKNPNNRTVNLGIHEEIIRKMLLDNNSKGIYDYPFIFYSFINKINYYEPGSYIRVFRSPILQKINYGHEYAMQLPGFLLIIRISKLTNKKYVELSYINNDKIRVFFLPEQDAKNLVNKSLGVKVF